MRSVDDIPAMIETVGRLVGAGQGLDAGGELEAQIGKPAPSPPNAWRAAGGNARLFRGMGRAADLRIRWASELIELAGGGTSSPSVPVRRWPGSNRRRPRRSSLPRRTSSSDRGAAKAFPPERVAARPGWRISRRCATAGCTKSSRRSSWTPAWSPSARACPPCRHFDLVQISSPNARPIIVGLLTGYIPMKIAAPVCPDLAGSDPRQPRCR